MWPGCGVNVIQIHSALHVHLTTLCCCICKRPKQSTPQVSAQRFLCHDAKSPLCLRQSQYLHYMSLGIQLLMV